MVTLGLISSSNGELGLYTTVEPYPMVFGLLPNRGPPLAEKWA